MAPEFPLSKRPCHEGAKLLPEGVSKGASSRPRSCWKLRRRMSRPGTPGWTAFSRSRGKIPRVRDSKLALDILVGKFFKQISTCNLPQSAMTSSLLSSVVQTTRGSDMDNFFHPSTSLGNFLPSLTFTTGDTLYLMSATLCASSISSGPLTTFGPREEVQGADRARCSRSQTLKSRRAKKPTFEPQDGPKVLLLLRGALRLTPPVVQE